VFCGGGRFCWGTHGEEEMGGRDGRPKNGGREQQKKWNGKNVADFTPGRGEEPVSIGQGGKKNLEIDRVLPMVLRVEKEHVLVRNSVRGNELA